MRLYVCSPPSHTLSFLLSLPTLIFPFTAQSCRWDWESLVFDRFLLKPALLEAGLCWKVMTALSMVVFSLKKLQSHIVQMAFGNLFLTCGLWAAQLLTAHDVMPFFRLSHGKPICDVHAVIQDQPHLGLLPLTPVSGIYCTCLILEPQDLTQCPLTF